jgi:hypothetical protein
VSTWIQSPYGGGGGAIIQSAVTVTTTYTAKAADGYILADGSGGAFTVTLPTSGVATGRTYLVKKIDGASTEILVQPATGTIDARPSIPLDIRGDYTAAMWDGSTYRVVGGYFFTGGLRTGDSYLTDANGNLVMTITGTGLVLSEGSNATQGTAVLNGTTAVVVSNTTISANSRIYLTIQTPGGTPGAPYVSAISAGVSFSVKSTNAADSSTVAYLIVSHL